MESIKIRSILVSYKKRKVNLEEEDPREKIRGNNPKGIKTLKRVKFRM